MGKGKKSGEVLFIIAIIVIIICLINCSITFYRFLGIEKLTGKASDAGTANLSIQSQASITFVVDSINWGSGAVDQGAGHATIDSEGNITDGNWTPVSQGLVIRNDGNQNILLNISSSNTASAFIGGYADGGPVYELKVTDNESNSCISGLADTYADAIGSNQPGCGNFSCDEDNDTLRIDVKLEIPQDAFPGAKGSVITAVGIIV
jgi:hypothetical protein